MASRSTKRDKSHSGKRGPLVKPRLDVPAPRAIPDKKREAARRRCRDDKPGKMMEQDGE